MIILGLRRPHRDEELAPAPAPRAMKTYWNKTTGDRVDYVQIVEEHVIVGRHRGSGHTDEAGSASFADFLEGRYHDVISAEHGPEVLEAVVDAVRQRIERP